MYFSLLYKDTGNLSTQKWMYNILAYDVIYSPQVTDVMTLNDTWPGWKQNKTLQKTLPT